MGDPERLTEHGAATGITSRLAGVARRGESARAAASEREVHDERTASILGVALGVAFGLCLLTGLWSHLQQQPPSWFTPPTGPVGLYRVTQGLHVIAGLASVPLLLAKLFSVSPHLWRRPPVHGAIDAMERLGLLPLVGGSLFLLVTGVGNIAHWYPWRFFFPAGHWWAAWLVLGATIVHVALKAPTVRRALLPTAGAPATGRDRGPGELSRRGLLLTVAGAAGLLTLLTAGQTVPLLRGTNLLGPRRSDVGPQGIPVNRTAAAAGTTGLASDPAYRLEVRDVRSGSSASFTVEDLRTMPQRTAELPIACVEGWSASSRWTGVRVADVLAAAEVDAGPVTVRSAQRSGLYSSSELSDEAAAGDECLLALRIDGQDLHADHGAPVRLIAPNRPGVLQTKWVTRLEVG
ncbi:molybdopterin-dependent oxidoreductase [Dermatobacter hominis]|uniref:molybdopterin-dependent oxidoreductase n=1 Tax=Dermatobacter hominis TaxID=2884263 RepID=UPI001D1247FE|nr:molybdopterin-dependent oxidoreductase [Dermatobacter hominis]UDY34928.1 molybdopterin-dependent oxidoreductase [Dermatobacter hominis]